MDELIKAWSEAGLFTRFMLIFWGVAPLIIVMGYWIKEMVNKEGNSPIKLSKENVENFHGTLVKDPYRYLENPQHSKVKKWVEKQNNKTEKYLKDYLGRDKIKTRLTELWNYPKTSLPIEVRGKFFFIENDGLKNQPSLYMKEGLEAERILIVDPNLFSGAGTVAITNFSVSKNAKYLAYSLSEQGSDWQRIYVKNLVTLEDIPDQVNWCKFSSIEWLGDDGFYYTRFPQPGSVPHEDESNYQKVYYHKMGSHQGEDILIYERADCKELGFTSIVSNDEKYLCLNIWLGTDSKNRFYYKELKKDGPFIKLLDDHDAAYHFIGNKGEVFYFISDLETPKGSLIAIDISFPHEIVEIVPQTNDVLADAAMFKDGFVLSYRHNSYYKLMVADINGDVTKEIELPGIGTIEGLWIKEEGTELFYNFTSVLYPNTIFRYDLATGKSHIFGKQTFNFDYSLYETKQFFYNSKDGTKISMFVTHRKDLDLNGDNPTLLYGYGGFNVSVTPLYSPATTMFLEQGGIYAIANLRGGSEYGEQWHRDGMLEKKQNVFDDFIAASEWLIEKKYTNNKKLAIMGRSNGGLLVAACMVQRPDLFGAVLCGVPVTDMLRYNKFTVGSYWVSEYGNPQNSEHFPFLYAYSPLHNVKNKVEYPPTLITTADSDDRVVPAHAYKFGATLQKAQKGKSPILVRVDTGAGHGKGKGKPTSMVIEEQADIFSFIFKVMGSGNW